MSINNKNNLSRPHFLEGVKLIVSLGLVVFLVFIVLVVSMLDTIWTSGTGSMVDHVSAESRQQEISKEINDMNVKINSYKSLISSSAQEEQDLEQEKAKLDKVLNELVAQKKETQAAVDDNLNKIEDIQKEIEQYEIKEAELRVQLAELIRLIYEYQEDTSLTILLAEDKLSNIINRLDNISNIQENLNKVVDRTHELKEEQKAARTVLISKQEELDVLYRTITEQENETQSLVAYKQTLIAEANEAQAAYERRLASAKQMKDSLSKELTLLSNGGKITFEMAVAAAKRSGGLTGIRPALMLGVLKQETNFGANVGTATYHTAYKGSSAAKNIKIFKQITQELGLNPEKTKVSAWPGYGSGGAMGPCQFMPQTWMGYKDEVKQLNGSGVPNPWDINDCVTAMGLKLARNGARSQQYNDEWRAVAMYFAGSNWNNPKFSFYPNNVMALAEAYEKQI